MKNKMKFGLIRIMRRRKQVIPLMGCMALSTAGAIFASLYFLFTKNDVILNTSRNPEPWEGVDPSKPQKLVTINQKWRPIEELEQVKSMTK
ncbi:Normal mucosa of esophagus-specific gene 1 protein [Salmo salar]|uniref:Normal mucosa of esophagus-specific gene 1 protein n=1 Tax=Salmo salar TaxID=8030 RepID=B9EMX0_SALSA|nr:Normal mucosa of esophagus-specific gene 1 protein [Salmo salar]ACM08867.1 Normal mucosa of esophagus-specific gene 1 protein [Salmo salar]ACM09571.1 Normal mucosa of esophagus-specific gene 1 protein [Salmo salar]|eukprot:NP_001139955.1 Normal mucosa of esophagus-specific gene 1 protein [Salmo salar]